MGKKLIVISVIIFVILTITVWFVAITRVNIYTENLNHIESSKSENRLSRANTELLNLYETSKKKVLFLSDLVQLDYNENLSFEKSKDILLLFLKNNDGYFQARVIDSSGMELINIENVHNNITVFKQQNLENKFNRYYFQEAIKLKKGKVYTSDLDLNIENNEIEIPYRPTIRFFTSFYDSEHKTIGVVGLNLDAEEWLNFVGSDYISILNSKKELYYSNEEDIKLYDKSAIDLTTKDVFGNPIYKSKKIILEGHNDWTIYTSLNTPLIKKKIDSFKKTTYLMTLFLNLGILFFAYTIHKFYFKNKYISSLNTSINLRLEERNTLLKEIHHRVKNNLQVITSLLNLQARYIKDEEVKSMLKYSQYRIQSMALLHETLYKSTDLSKINYSDYVNQLVSGLIVSMKGSNNKIDLELDIDNIHFNIDTSIPLGLTINEIVTNSLKYAFINEKGIISIKLKKNTNNSYLLEIGDNGKGFPKDVTFRNTETLGLKLVHKLVVQLNGNIEKDNTKTGTNYIINFEEIQELS
ncbi:hypothetical protein H0I23_07950 [Cellulophaga sp. HaHaR_3_176]|uniref:sensor histidine kinase n=1 Tax=Cellulophaga sp. HaHaR_3_176 TaxID=1942464 RepID=UPI001C1F7877|nr:sensor histidine kinase [Cellulophaga sp. HaHaR_3_176]QWX85561.1 hypothetical protein H0I23_07950 [Cellulophaga sp. HaHaR_3_176]